MGRLIRWILSRFLMVLRLFVSFAERCQEALSHTMTIFFLSGCFTVRSIRAWVMVPVSCQSRVIKSTVPSVSCRKAM